MTKTTFRAGLLACALLLAPSLAMAQTQPLPAALGGGGQYIQNVPMTPCVAPAGGGNGTCTYVAPDQPFPVKATPYANPTTLAASSGNVANASAVATLAGATGKTTFLTSFACTASGATAASVQNLTVTGLAGGTLTFSFVFPAGVTTAAAPLVVTFPTPMAASATNTAVVVTLPAGGSGNTNAACDAAGFQQ